MATFSITSPEGVKYRITAPEGATEEQAYAVLQNQLASAPKPQPQDTSLIQNVGEGAVNLGKGLLTGASNVATGIASIPKYVGLPPVWGQEWIDRSKAANKEFMKDTGLAGSVGEFAAEMAGTSGLGGGAVRGARMLPQALNWFRGPMGAAALEGAAASGILGHGNWNDVAIGAAGGAVGQKVLGGLARKVAQPIAQTAEADALRRAGIEVTAGQGASGYTGKVLEESLRHVPGVKAQRALPYEQIRAKVLQESMPPMNPLQPRAGSYTPHGANIDEMIENAHSIFSKQYEGVVHGKPFTVNVAYVDDIVNGILNPKNMMSQSQQQTVARYVSDHALGPLREAIDKGVPISGDRISVIRRNLDQKAAEQANPEMARALREASDKLLEMMARQDPKVGEVYTRLAPAYQNLVTTEAAAKAAKAQGKFGVGQLTSAAEREGNREMTKLGRLASTTLTDDMATGGGMRTALGLTGLALGAGGGYMGGGPVGMVAVPAAALSLMGTRGGQRALSGQLAKQKALAEFLKRHPTTGGVATAELSNEALGD
jgi:hypothetical protein